MHKARKALVCLLLKSALMSKPWNVLAIRIALVLAALLPSMSRAALKCSEVHHDQLDRFYSQLDETAVRSSYDKFMAQFQGKPLPPGFDPHKIFNVATMGVLGDIYDFRIDPAQKKSLILVNEPRMNEVRKRTEILLSRGMGRVSPELESMLKEAVDVRELTDSTVMITAKLVSTKHLQGFTQALHHRYQRVGAAVVDFVYRFSKLEAEEIMTGLTMLDEITKIIKERRGYSIHLVYDKSVWEMEKKILSVRLEDYQKAHEGEEQQKLINQVNQPIDPFLPTTGVVTTEFVLPNSKSIEFKRYFQNPKEDPLGMVEVPKKSEQLLRLLMLYRVAEGLPAGSTFEIHAHTEKHMRAYLRLGFVVEKESENPLYPGIKVYHLKGQREQVLQTSKALIGRIQSGG